MKPLEPPTFAKTYTNRAGARIVVSPVSDESTTNQRQYDLEWLDADGAVKHYRAQMSWAYAASVLRQGQYR